MYKYCCVYISTTVIQTHAINVLFVVLLYCIIFTETERRIRANNREYNSQFNYAVRRNISSCITNCCQILN